MGVEHWGRPRSHDLTSARTRCVASVRMCARSARMPGSQPLASPVPAFSPRPVKTSAPVVRPGSTEGCSSPTATRNARPTRAGSSTGRSPWSWGHGATSAATRPSLPRRVVRRARLPDMHGGMSTAHSAGRSSRSPIGFRSTDGRPVWCSMTTPWSIEPPHSAPDWGGSAATPCCFCLNSDRGSFWAP